MQKVLITGATGFVGRYVVQSALNAGASVIATSAVRPSEESFDWLANVTYLPFDLKTADYNQNLFDYFLKPDILIHLAWEGLPNYKGDFHIAENLPRHQLFLDNIIRNGLKDVAVTGTCLEYGLQEGCLSEDLVCAPVTNYGRAKLLLLQYLQKIQATNKFDLKWIRLFYMFGSGQNTNSLFSQLNMAMNRHEKTFAMSGGEQERDFLPVSVVANNIIKIAFSKRISGIYNCAGGRPQKVKDLAKEIVESKKSKIHLDLGRFPYPDYEPMSFYANIDKLNSI